MVSSADLASFQAGPESEIDSSATVEDLRRLMESGDETGAWDMLTATGVHDDPLRAQQELIAPALRQIGERWAVGEATIAQEHIASGVALRLIARLGTPRRRGRRSGTVIVCCPNDDPHTLATALFSNLVRAEGADVVDLGRVDGPSDVLARVDAIEGHVSVAVAVTGPDLHDATRALVGPLKSHEGVRAVLVGGRAVPDEITALDLGSDLYFNSPELAAAGAVAAARS